MIYFGSQKPIVKTVFKEKTFFAKKGNENGSRTPYFSKGPQRVAPFSHAVRAGEYLFITGQMPTLKNDNTKLVEGGIEEQTRQVMKNLIDVLNAAGSSLEKVIFARVYLVNFHDFNRMNEVYSSFFKSDKLPGRTCIGVTGLAVGSLVEIDFVAAA